MAFEAGSLSSEEESETVALTVKVRNVVLVISETSLAWLGYSIGGTVH